MQPETFNYRFWRAPRDSRSRATLLGDIGRYTLELKRPITLPLLREVRQTPLDI